MNSWLRGWLAGLMVGRTEPCVAEWLNNWLDGLAIGILSV